MDNFYCGEDFLDLSLAFIEKSDIDLAIEAIELSIKTNSKEFRAWLIYGYLLVKKYRYEDALKAYFKAFGDDDPFNAQDWQYLQYDRERTLSIKKILRYFGRSNVFMRKAYLNDTLVIDQIGFFFRYRKL